MDASARKQVATWLFVCCAMVLSTLVVGGITRLTHSGLSIVEWQPLVGTLPPLDAQQWQEVFAKYQRTPEYHQVNRGMSLGEFKTIFWWEYVHRLLGRSIGAVFLLPFGYFLVRRRLDPKLVPRLAGIFLLGGLQGAMGWYMVKSGLVDDPRVSQYRLAAHLGLAFIIFAALFWAALGLLAPRAQAAEPSLGGLRRRAAALAALAFVMVLSGALVAGIHAGLAYNSFPLMDGHFVPPGILLLEPWWLNFFNNMATVQFDHRAIAWLLALLVPWLWWRCHGLALGGRLPLACGVMLGALCVQIALGIATLLNRVPVPLAAAHQTGAMVLFAAILWVNHELRVGRGSRAAP